MGVASAGPPTNTTPTISTTASTKPLAGAPKRLSMLIPTLPFPGCILRGRALWLFYGTGHCRPARAEVEVAACCAHTQT